MTALRDPSEPVRTVSWDAERGVFVLPMRTETPMRTAGLFREVQSGATDPTVADPSLGAPVIVDRRGAPAFTSADAWRGARRRGPLLSETGWLALTSAAMAAALVLTLFIH
jgi:hypothetical protein